MLTSVFITADDFSCILDVFSRLLSPREHSYTQLELVQGTGVFLDSLH